MPVLDFLVFVLGNLRSMGKNKDNSRWKSSNPVRWLRGIRLHHPIGQRPWIPWFSALLLSLLFSTLVVVLRVRLCCGKFAMVSTVTFSVWNVLCITLGDILPNCSFVLPLKALSDSCAYKFMSVLPSKIRMNYFFQSLHSAEFKKNALEDLILGSLVFVVCFLRNGCSKVDEENGFSFWLKSLLCALQLAQVNSTLMSVFSPQCTVLVLFLKSQTDVR